MRVAKQAHGPGRAVDSDLPHHSTRSSLPFQIYSRATMSSRTTVLITGATGKQGGSVIAALLVKNIVAIRALTRSVDSPAAHALSSKGAVGVQIAVLSAVVANHPFGLL